MGRLIFPLRFVSDLFADSIDMCFLVALTSLVTLADSTSCGLLNNRRWSTYSLNGPSAVRRHYVTLSAPPPTELREPTVCHLREGHHHHGGVLRGLDRQLDGAELPQATAPAQGTEGGQRLTAALRWWRRGREGGSADWTPTEVATAAISRLSSE